MNTPGGPKFRDCLVLSTLPNNLPATGDGARGGARRKVPFSTIEIEYNARVCSPNRRPAHATQNHIDRRDCSSAVWATRIHALWTRRTERFESVRPVEAAGSRGRGAGWRAHGADRRLAAWRSIAPRDVRSKTHGAGCDSRSLLADRDQRAGDAGLRIAAEARRDRRAVQYSAVDGPHGFLPPAGRPANVHRASGARIEKQAGPSRLFFDRQPICAAMRGVRCPISSACRRFHTPERPIWD